MDIQKSVTHISEILHGGTKTFAFRHLEIQIVDCQVENKNISDRKKNRLRYCIGINLRNFFRQKSDFWNIVGYALLNIHFNFEICLNLYFPKMQISKKQKLCWVVLGDHNKSLPYQYSLRRILFKINSYFSISKFV